MNEFDQRRFAKLVSDFIMASRMYAATMSVRA